MADARLEVQVGADISELSKKLRQGGTAEKIIEGFSSSGGRSLQSLQSETRKTGVAFTGFSRVLQDAAFGPAAIANNLEGLGNDLSQLRRQASETGQSVGRTLVQSLAGAGGLNLALGAVTLGLSLASFGLSAWTRLFPDNEKKVKSAKDATEAYVKSLSDARRVSLEGAQQAQTDLINLRVLYERTQDLTRSVNQRREAADELQRMYPRYFANLSDEAILAGRAESAYNRLTVALIATARAEAARALISEKQKQILVNQQQEADILQERIQLRERLARADAKLEAITRSGVSDEAINFAVTERNRIYDSLVENTQRYNERVIENNRLQGQSLALMRNINQQLDRGATLTGNLGAPLPSVQKEERRDIKIRVETVGVDAAKNGIDQLSGSLDNVTIASTRWIGEWEKSMARLSESFSNSVTNGITDFVSGFLEGIAGLATGTATLNDVGSALLGIIGNIAIQLGQAAIAIGVGMIAIKSAFSNPLTAIAAGAALVAIGGLIKGAAKITQGTGSVAGSGSYATPNTERASTNYSYSASANTPFNGTVVFEIAGRKLVGVLQNELGRNLRVT